MKEKAIVLYEHLNANTMNVIASNMDGQLDEYLPLTFAEMSFHQALKFAAGYLSDNHGIPKRNIWAVRLTDKHSDPEFALFDITKIPLESRGYVTPDLLPFPHITASHVVVKSSDIIGYDSSSGSQVH